MDGRTRLAWNLRRIRTVKGVTQENLAVDAGVDRTSVSGIERADYNPSVDLLDKLAAALGVDISELFIIPRTDAVPPQPLRAGRKPGKARV